MKPRMFGVLSETERAEKVRGRLFKKEVVRFGKYKDPLWGEFEMNLDEAWAEQVIANWKAGIPGRVPVPSMHTDDPDRNRGEVVDYEITRRGIVAYLDIRDDETAQAIENETIWDVSISFVDNWIDNKGKEHGPAILHVALVNNPYLDKMSEFEALSRTMGDLFGGLAQLAKGQSTSAIMLSRGTNLSSEDSTMNKKKITNDRDFPVSVQHTDDEGNTQDVVLEPGQELEVLETEAEAVTQSIADAEKPSDDGGAGDGGDAGAGDGGEGGDGSGDGGQAGAGDGGDGGEGGAQETDAEKLSRIEAENAQLKAEKLEAEAEKQFSQALKEGKVVPAQKDAFMALSKARGSVDLSATDKKTIPELLSDFVNSAPKAVDFSEKGKQNNKQNRQDSEDESPEAPKYEDLSDEQRAGLKALGVSKERFEKVSLSNPNAFRDLVTKDKE